MLVSYQARLQRGAQRDRDLQDESRHRQRHAVDADHRQRQAGIQDERATFAAHKHGQ